MVIVSHTKGVTPKDVRPGFRTQETQVHGSRSTVTKNAGNQSPSQVSVFFLSSLLSLNLESRFRTKYKDPDPVPSKKQ